jgi:hypothetical protein
VSKPVYQQGMLVGHVQEYSDGLLTLLLKAKRPSEFRDGERETGGASGGVLVVPGTQPLNDWEAAAASGQAAFRGTTLEGTAQMVHERDPLE